MSRHAKVSDKGLNKFIPKFTDLDCDVRKNVMDYLEEGSKPSIDFYILTALSAIIASLGLLTNNVAVIIGAMLVAPLMTPLLSISMAAITGNLKLLHRSLRGEFSGFIVAIVISGIFGYFFLFDSSLVTFEILTRTQPTLFELFVALASGAAGAYAIGKNKNASLPGVAIAVAIIPPLAVIGISIASKSFGNAFGAAILFITNVVAINFAASIVFFLLGYAPKWSMQVKKETYKTLRTSAMLVLILFVVLVYFTIGTVGDALLREKINYGLTEHLTAYGDVSLDSFEFNEKEGILTINAQIFATSDFDGQEVIELRNSLQRDLGKRIELKVNVIPWQVYSDED